ncbi:MAG: hypothetical protein KAS69_05000 [Planctomycetes bacterium]|nr:hypothetical protein [Planctomycetota bacterium]
MSRMIKTIEIMALFLFVVFAGCNTDTPQTDPKTDAERIQDVHYIAELCEQYKEKTGNYPYHDWFEDVEEGYVAVPVSVVITDQEIPEQYQYPPPGVSGYVDSVEELLKYFQSELGKKLKLPYDDSPIVYESPYVPKFYQFLYDGENYYVSAILTKPNNYTRELYNGYYKYQVSSVEDKQQKIRNYTKLRSEIKEQDK